MAVAKNIRNIALIGHSGEGKTTLAEAILFNAGAIDRQGKVDDGNSVMDFDAEEISRKISISLSIANCMFHDTKFNLIDVPGYFDFECEMFEALSACDGAVIVTSASGSLTVGTEKALDYCIANKIPALIFVNGVDKENANYGHTIDAIKAKYPKVASIMVPEFDGPKMVGYVNTIDGRYSRFGMAGASAGEIPAGLQKDYNLYHDAAIEIAASANETLMEKFFNEGTLSEEEVVAGMREGLAHGEIIPAVGGSALGNKGVHHLMKVITDIMPSADESHVEAKDANGNPVEIKADENGGVVLRVFKTITDPFVGKLSMFKVLRGTLKSGMTLRNVDKDTQEKISAVYFVKGKKQDTAECICAGDIGATAKLAVTTTGDTLCEGADIILPEVKLTKPVYSRAVYAAKKGDEDKIFGGLNKLKDEDIAFSVNKDPETGEMLISGLGETQLDVLCKKLKSKFNCEALLQEPRIPYRETIKKCVEGEGKHKKQSGGAGQYGHCKVRFEPGAEDGQFEFVDAVVGGAVPKQFIPSVEKGLRAAVAHGVLAGYPMVDLKCTLFDGSTHPVDGKDIAFQMAAKLAYADACARANPVILEPVYELSIVVPDNYLGDVMGDMNKRRGRIMGTEANNGTQVVTAEAPLSEITRYATDLRSMTQGRGSYELHFVRYEEVPPMNVDKIVAEAKKIMETEE